MAMRNARQTCINFEWPEIAALETRRDEVYDDHAFEHWLLCHMTLFLFNHGFVQDISVLPIFFASFAHASIAHIFRSRNRLEMKFAGRILQKGH